MLDYTCGFGLPVVAHKLDATPGRDWVLAHAGGRCVHLRNPYISLSGRATPGPQPNSEVYETSSKLKYPQHRMQGLLHSGIWF